jgi:hypothetical protein
MASSSDSSAAPMVDRWHTTYWASFQRKFTRSYSGFLVLRSKDSSVLLLSDEEKFVDCQPLEDGELIQSGMIITFPCHSASVQDRISLENSVDLASAPSLNFNRGVLFDESIQKKFGHVVNFIENHRRREFLMVVSFSRACFRLNTHTVAIALQACFGGSASKFRVHTLRDRTFRFSVASKSVGFEIYNAGKILENDFEISFNLWGNGGPNWLVEERKYYSGQDSSWTTVYRKKSLVFDRLEFQNPVLLARSEKRQPVFQRLEFQNPNLNNGQQRTVTIGNSTGPSFAEVVISGRPNSPGKCLNNAFNVVILELNPQ